MADRDAVPTVDERGALGKADPDPSPDPGTGSDRYVRGVEIARGGMGRVVEAEDAMLGRTVALKETLAVDGETRERFEREVRITAKLEHPSIVPLYDAGVGPDGAPFYVMRRVSGQPLDRKIAAAADLDARLTLLPNLLAVLDAVGHAHRRGIIHRDLKPANVLVGELGETVVIDWGLAKVIGEIEPAPDPASSSSSAGSGSSATVAGVAIGTPGFMPPEQVIGDVVDARSDVYALGATLYLLLAGRPPFTGASATEILDRAVAGPPPPLPEMVAGAPPDLVTIVETAMAPDREARFADAAVMGEELRRFLSGQLVASHHYSSRQRLARFVRRNRAVLAVVALAVVAIAAIGVLSLRRIVRDRDRIAAARAEAETKRGEAETNASRLRDLADGLIVDQARGHLRDDPTFSAAMIEQLPLASTKWDEARAVLIEARARGIAYALPGHGGRVLSLELAGDGRRLVSHGSDGGIRVHDLIDRTSVEIGRSSSADVYRWAGDTIAIRRLGSTLTVIDSTTGRELRALDDDAMNIDTRDDGSVAWVDKAGAIRIADRDGVVTDVDLGAGAYHLELDLEPDLVASTADGVRLYRRDGATWKHAWSDPGKIDSMLQVSRDRRRLALTRDGAVVEIAIEPDQPPVVRRTIAVPDVLFATYLGRNLVAYRRTPERIEWVDLGRDEEEPISGPRTFAVARSFSMSGPMPVVDGNLVVFAGGNEPPDQITLAGVDRVIRLRGSERVLRVAARAGSRFIVGGTASHLLVWDLDEIVPAVLESPIGTMPATIAPLGARYLAMANEMFASIVDTETGKLVDLAPYDTQMAIAVSSIDDIVVRMVTPSLLQIVDTQTGTLDYVEMTPDSYFVVRDRATLLLGEPNGKLVEVAIRSKQRRVVGDLGGPARGADRALTWTMVWNDRRAWRTNGSASQSLDLAEPPIAATIAPDGSIYLVTTDRTIARWPPNATSTVDVLQSVVALRDITAPHSPDLLFVVSADHALWRLDAGKRTMVQLLPAVDSPPRVSPDGRCAATTRDKIGVIGDLARATWWTMPDIGVAIAGGTPAIDCGRAFMVSSSGVIHEWNIALPDDPADVRRWLVARTNARTSTTDGVIEWIAP